MLEAKKIRVTTKLLRAEADQPRHKLGLEAMRLVEFFEALGAAMFGLEWRDGYFPSKEIPCRSTLAGAREQVAQIVDQVGLSFASGEITAALICEFPERHDFPGKVEANLCEEKMDDDDELPDLSEEEETEEANLIRFYPLHPRAWDDYWPANITNWPTSQMRCSVENVLVSVGNPYRPEKRRSTPLLEARKDLTFAPKQILEAPVVVLRADYALRALLPLGPLPKPAEAHRYTAFRNRLVDEVVAATWRAIAVKSLGRNEIQPRIILKIMYDYMLAQGIDGDSNSMSEKLLETLAGKICRQWNQRSLTTQVFLNSTSIKPLKPSG